MKPTRRQILTIATASVALPQAVFANTPKVITWDDLIPPGVPYPQIVGEGQMDEQNDSWRPLFDMNASRLNPVLNGEYVKIPGYIIPIDLSKKGVTSFVLVPYVGACIHTPPPPPNQLIFVTTETPWSRDSLWDPVWVTGRMRHERQSTEVADTGYMLTADAMETYEW